MNFSEGFFLRPSHLLTLKDNSVVTQRICASPFPTSALHKG